MVIAAFPLAFVSAGKAKADGSDSLLSNIARAVLVLGSLLFIAQLLGWITPPTAN